MNDCNYPLCIICKSDQEILIPRNEWFEKCKEVTKLKSQLEKAEAVIKHYDDERNWDGWEIQGDDICYSDDYSEEGYAHGGKRAREYFEEKEDK